MKSTVVIPNFNGIKYIENCIVSLLECRKHGSDFHIIMIDNGSIDGSLELVKSKFLDIEYIEFKENTGFCVAVNAGILAAKTKYVILLNNDTIVEPSFIEELERVAEKDSTIFSVSAKMIDLYQKEQLDGTGDFYTALGWAFARGKGKSSKRYEKEGKIFSACAGAALYRTSIFEHIGIFDENHFAYLEDCDIGYRAQIYGYQNYYAPKAIVYHAGSGVSGSRYNTFKIELSSKNSIYLIYKNMPLLQIVINFPFLLLGFLIKYMFFLKKGYGTVYLKGILEGIKLSNSKNGKRKKVKVTLKNLQNYIKIELQLFVNIIKRVL
ncbi:MAG: glycosyltransferase family 2 protein [Lachnospiraceae bacterium]